VSRRNPECIFRVVCRTIETAKLFRSARDAGGSQRVSQRRTSVVNGFDSAIALISGRPLLPNHGIPLNLDWVREVRVNTSAVERRAQSQVTRRTVKKEWQRRGFCERSPAWI
jgi:hypothetical protein